MNLNELLKTELGKKQYRELAMKFHSDLGGDEDLMKQANAAKDSDNGDMMIARLYKQHISTPVEQEKSYGSGRFSNVKISPIERPTQPKPVDDIKEMAEEILMDITIKKYPTIWRNIQLFTVPYTRDIYTVFLSYTVNNGVQRHKRVSINFKYLVSAQLNRDSDSIHQAEKEVDKFVYALDDIIGDQMNELFDKFKKSQEESEDEKFLRIAYDASRKRGYNEYSAMQRAKEMLADKKKREIKKN